MILRSSHNIKRQHKPPTSFGGLFFKGSQNLPFVSEWMPFVRNSLLLFVSLFFSGVASAALLMTQQPPAVLTWSDGSITLQTNFSVLRYENIGFYRYDPNASENFTVWEGNFADQDSLTGTPALLDTLPAPVDSNGNPLALNGSIPLAEVSAYEFALNEPLFIVAQGPILPPSAFATRPDGKRYIAITIDIGNGDSHIITLVETNSAPNTGIFIGYLQANIPSSSVVIPAGSTLSIRYDNYGDVPDSDTINAPWFVNPANFNLVANRKLGSISTTPPITPVYDMFLSKQALRTSAVQGDFIAYELRLENTGNVLLNNVEILDAVPTGFRYQKKSSKLGGFELSDPIIDGTGQNLTFNVGNLAVGQEVVLRYVLEVTVAAKVGKAINHAQAQSGTASSNAANAVVSVEQPFFNDRAFLLGRVIVGNCGEDEGQGLGGVRLYMEDGTSVITDDKGRWHIEGIMPGTHVLQLDTLTLGSHYTLQQCQSNTRQAGNPVSRFVNVQGGTMWRENWYINKRWGTDANVEQQLSTSALDSGELSVELAIRTGDREFQELLTQITLPEGVHIVSESVVLDGVSIANLDQRDGMHEITLQPEGRFAKYTLGFALAIDPNAKQSIEGVLQAETTALSKTGAIYSVKSKNILDVKGLQNNDNNIVIRPKFSSMSANLSELDKTNIEPSLKQLIGREGLYLEVVGHSDSQPIKPKAGRAINDNYALSEARATSVAEFVATYLNMDMARIRIEGKGPDMPIADNTTAEGRAKNRRVALSFRFTEKVKDATLGVLEAYSGINSDLDASVQKELFHVDSGELAIKDSNKKPAGFVNLKEGMAFAQSIFSATALMEEKLKPKLMVDGKEIPDGRIGMKMMDLESGLVRYTWIGLELDQVGDHVIELSGLDNFGNARFKQAINVRLSSKIKTIHLEDAGNNMADGRSPIKIRLKLLDESDQEITTQTELEVVSGNLRPLNNSQQDNPLEARGNVVIVDPQGYVHFEPVGSAGNYRIRLAASDTVYQDIEISVAPDLREWILVGFAEGTVGYNTLNGNMNNLSDQENHTYTDGDAAFFARGKVKGEWLLTAAYDSRRVEDDSPLMQRIDPQRWYVLYGDDTLRGHDAPSRKKLYVRMEKTDFYALFGDFDTGLSVTELTRYQRTLTGAKVEWKGKNAAATGFAAQTNQGFIRDDIAADGTSGLYRLSRQQIVLGSEEIYIETRDRFTNEVLESQLMTRYVDYNLDVIDGTLYFRQPVYVQDENFNPQRIVARYEVDAGEEEIVGGGRVSVYDADKKLEVGLTAVDDGTVGAEGSLGGVDVTWKPNQSHTLKAELAGSRQDDVASVTNNSSAGLVEYKYTSEKFDNLVRVEEKEGDFGLGQLATDDDDIRLAKASTRYRFSEEVVLSADASHQEMLATDNQRNSVETRFEYLQPDWKAYSGFRHSADTVNDDVFESEHLIAGGQRYYQDRKLLLSARGETAVDHNDNVDYPNLLSLGSDYRVSNRVSVFANQDFSWGEESHSQDTRLGARATPWKGASASSDVTRSQDEYGPRLLAHAGLFQAVPVSPHWTADFGFDRSQTLQDDSAPPVADVFDPRRDLANGTRNDDYTAVSAGAGYRTAQWQWTNRVEFRDADTDDKWTAMSGFQHRLDETDTMAGRLLYFDQQMNSGNDLRNAELDFSYSRRPLGSSWYWLNRSSLIVDELNDSLGKQEGQRLVNNTHLNFVYEMKHQLSLQYGARYVRDTIDELRFKGYSDLIGTEYRYDITEKWDVGLRGSTLASYNSDIRYNAFGVMAGYSPIKDVWISLGYNFTGFYDKDFTDAGTRVKGFVLNFRIKLDQNGARELPEKTKDLFDGGAS